MVMIQSFPGHRLYLGGQPRYFNGHPSIFGKSFQRTYFYFFILLMPLLCFTDGESRTFILKMQSLQISQHWPFPTGNKNLLIGSSCFPRRKVTAPKAPYCIYLSPFSSCMCDSTKLNLPQIRNDPLVFAPLTPLF